VPVTPGPPGPRAGPGRPGDAQPDRGGDDRPGPGQAAEKAAHVAKSLRVFLAADEHTREAKAEEAIAIAAPRPAQAAQEPVADEDEADEAAEEPREMARHRERAESDSPWGKVVALWDEIHPEVRDLVFLASGALLMLALIFLVELITGIRLSFIAGLATGAAASYFVEVFVRWRQGKTVGVP